MSEITSKYRFMTHAEFASSRGLSPRRYRCRTDYCDHWTYVFWYDINDMTFSIQCRECKGKSVYVAGKLRPIAVNGINQKGYYDKALGRYIESHAHKDKVMQEMGVRPVTNEEIETNMQEQINDAIEHERTVQTFTRTMNETNSFAAAARSISEE
jgi:hypothetical protein